MRIAQLAPLWETIPPRSYGGTELVVHLLTETLVKMGHEVTLFAANGSKTEATLEVMSNYPLRAMPKAMAHLGLEDQPGSLYPGSSLSTYKEMQMFHEVFSRADEFDIIHNHLGFYPLAFAGLVKTPIITTLHGAFRRKNWQDVVEQEFVEAFAHQPFVSISNFQRKPCPNLNYQGTIYHGLDVKAYSPSFTYEDKPYLAFIGRFCHDKGPHLAIQAALETGHRLLMAGKVDCDDELQYFKSQIEPYIDNDQIQYVGELNHPQKVDFLRQAKATLCPILWPEPFGLVIIESLACGTPVIAMRNGSVPEILEDGITGFIVDQPEEIAAKIGQLSQLDRRVCRDQVETRFSAQRMTADYISLFEKRIEKSNTLSPLQKVTDLKKSVLTDPKITVLPTADDRFMIS